MQKNFFFFPLCICITVPVYNYHINVSMFTLNGNCIFDNTILKKGKKPSISFHFLTLSVLKKSRSVESTNE